MKRIIALILVVVTLTLSLASCGYSMHDEDYKAYANYNKEEIVICVRGDNECVWEIGLEDDGAALSSELFERTGRTEERLNVVIAVNAVDGWGSYRNAISTMRNSIQQQQSVWDIISGWSPRIPQIAAEGLQRTWHGLYHLLSDGNREQVDL